MWLIWVQRRNFDVNFMFFQSTGFLLDRNEVQKPALDGLFNNIRDIYLEQVFKPWVYNLQKQFSEFESFACGTSSYFFFHSNKISVTWHSAAKTIRRQYEQYKLSFELV